MRNYNNMEIIKIKASYGITDLGDEEKIKSLLTKLVLPISNEISLDLSGCLIDYPVTSMLLDNVLYHLDTMPSYKKLNIIIDYNLPDDTLINFLFLGSRFLNINDKFKLIKIEWKTIITEMEFTKKIIIELRMPRGNKTIAP